MVSQGKSHSLLCVSSIFLQIIKTLLGSLPELNITSNSRNFGRFVATLSRERKNIHVARPNLEEMENYGQLAPSIILSS